MLTFAEKVKIVMGRRGMTSAELADKTNQSRQNLSNKMKRDNFTQAEMMDIASALRCTLVINLVMDDSGDMF